MDYKAMSKKARTVVSKWAKIAGEKLEVAEEKAKETIDKVEDKVEEKTKQPPKDDHGTPIQPQPEN